MQKRTGARGFFLGLGFILLWQSGWAAFALVVWLLHRWKGSPLFFCWAALGIWLLSALAATILIHTNAARAGTSAPAPENRNPYSTDNAQMFLGVANDAPPTDLFAPGEPPRTIVLIIWRKCIAQSLAQRLRDESNIHLVFEPSYSLAQNAVRSRTADAALIEAAESGDQHGISDCLALCARLREEAPQCRLLLMCPERNKEDVARAVEAKRLGRIDDFVFYNSSIDYVASKLLAM